MTELRPTAEEAGRPVRVVLADDQALVRAGFRSLLDHTDGVRVVGEAADGVEAVAEVVRTHPDVVLMDVRMPRLDGIAATRRICGEPSLRATHVLMLTTFELDDYVFEALRAGASGFLLKDVEPEDLRRAVRVVASGESLLSPRVTGRLIAEFVSRSPRPATAANLDVLTEREREVMALVGAGLSNEEISAHLFISESTAKTHVSRTMTKLNARDRAQLVVMAYESGLVRPGA
ncbi:MAG: response regulator [Acidimicrobiales bacterium]